MRKSLPFLIAVFMFMAAPQAKADFFSFGLDAQGTYTRLDKISFSNVSDPVTLDGFGIGVSGKLQILFITAIIDYQHLLDGADYMHAGLGTGFTFGALPLVDLYVRGSLGLMLLSADVAGFDETPGAGDISPPEVGFQVRGGAGIEIPFLGDFFAFGLGVDVGAHAITGNWGYDLSVNAHLGLRI